MDMIRERGKWAELRLRGAAYVLPVTNVNPLSVTCTSLCEVFLLSRKDA